MKSTFCSLVIAMMVGALSLTAYAETSNTRPDTGSLHTRVPREPGKGSPAAADYQSDKQKCDSKSGQEKTKCLAGAREAYQRELAAERAEQTTAPSH
jgi:hypothetical protein